MNYNYKNEIYMAEIIIVEILVAVGLISLLTYLITSDMRKNHKRNKTHEEGREIVRYEKELDKTDSIKRSIELLKVEEKV
jgi:hypothetical protein